MNGKDKCSEDDDDDEDIEIDTSVNIVRKEPYIRNVSKIRRRRRRRKINASYLRGLRRCCSEAQSDDVDSTNNDELSSFSTTTVFSTSSKCPIDGSFVDRDSNAATNIALKLLVGDNNNNNIQNLVRGTRIKQQRFQSVFWLDNHQFYSKKNNTTE